MSQQNLAERCSFPAKLAMLSLAALLIQSCAQPAPAQSPTPPATAAQQPTVAPGPLSRINTVTLNGVVYNDTAAALAAYRDIEEKPVAALSREADPLKGRALIVLPDHDRLRPLVSQEQLILRKQAVIGDALDFFIEQRRLSLHALADALSQNGTFENVTMVEQNDVLNPEPGNADFLIWFQVRTQLPNNQGAWLGQWQVRRNTNPTVNGAGVDPGTAPGTPRYASFTKSVREAALRLGGRSISGVTSASMGGNGAGSPAVSGSGIIVDTQGHILTNEHVIRSCTDPRITDTSNMTYRATILAKDTANDLALLKAEHRWPEAASFRDGREPRPGDPVVVTGYPLAGVTGSGMAVTTGSVTSLTGPRDDSRLLQLSAPVQPGNSGGPLLDNNGHVTGVVTSTLNGMVLALATGVVPQNVNFAVKVGIARNFLDTQDINYAHAPAGHELAAGDIGQLAKRFTVRINCGGTP